MIYLALVIILSIFSVLNFPIGTISGPEKHERGCLLELTWGGKEPITLASGETRTFLKDGDEILMTGYCESKNG